MFYLIEGVYTMFMWAAIVVTVAALVQAFITIMRGW